MIYGLVRLPISQFLQDEVVILPQYTLKDIRSQSLKILFEQTKICPKLQYTLKISPKLIRS